MEQFEVVIRKTENRMKIQVYENRRKLGIAELKISEKSIILEKLECYNKVAFVTAIILNELHWECNKSNRIVWYGKGNYFDYLSYLPNTWKIRII